MVVRDIKVRYPQTVPVFEQLGFRESCDDCSLDQVAKKYGMRVQQIVTALNETVFGPQP